MFRAPARFLSLLFCLSLMGAAEEPPVLPPQDAQHGQSLRGGVWLDVPFVPQEKEGCGAAAVAMVLQYWQAKGQLATKADPAEIQRALYSKEAHGIYASEMEHYFASKGFKAFAFKGAWNELDRHLEKGRPLIVAMRPAGSSPLHYVVVVGLDWGRGLVLVNDPAQKKLLKLDRLNFEREWNAAGKWTLLAVPQSGAR